MVDIHSDNKGTKDGAVLSKDVMENEKSSTFTVKAFGDINLFQSTVVTKFPDAIEITIDHDKGSGGNGISHHLTPPVGTVGFMNQMYKIYDTDWTADVYAYRHAKSNDVTVIVLHSGLCKATENFAVYATPVNASKSHSHYPVSYDSEVGGKYSYHISYTRDINMIGPDKKNPIVVKAAYEETFIGSKNLVVEVGTDGLIQVGKDGTKIDLLSFCMGDSGEIHGMSVINASFEVGTSIFIEFVEGGVGNINGGTVEVKV